MADFALPREKHFRTAGEVSRAGIVQALDGEREVGNIAACE
jgi:hypothetical protein